VQFRQSQSADASPHNLKRAPGGTQQIELLVQFLQLTFAGAHPRILTPGALDAIARLRDCGLLEQAHAAALEENYRFLRSIESRLRLMNTQARHDLPSNDLELRSLAQFVGAESGAALQEQCAAAMSAVQAVISAREATLARELSP
jgi:[glutamine synthetase] adenylyltransferase / [glutamine synthetase]-adenylyl-L-tyrosine phosphorylase